MGLSIAVQFAPLHWDLEPYDICPALGRTLVSFFASKLEKPTGGYGSSVEVSSASVGESSNKMLVRCLSSFGGMLTRFVSDRWSGETVFARGRN